MDVATAEPAIETLSLEDVDSADESGSLRELMAELRGQMREVQVASQQIRHKIKDLYKRAKKDTTHWMQEPLTLQPHVRSWARKRGLPPTPSIEQFLGVVFGGAVSMELEGRKIVLSRQDAAVLTGGTQEVTVFELIARLPKLFE
jgi:hypothetical protein